MSEVEQSCWKCSLCNGVIDRNEFESWNYCNKCLSENKEILDISQNMIQFKKELNGLFYYEVGDCWSLHPEETKFFMKRWGIWND